MARGFSIFTECRHRTRRGFTRGGKVTTVQYRNVNIYLLNIELNYKYNLSVWPAAGGKFLSIYNLRIRKTVVFVAFLSNKHWVYSPQFLEQIVEFNSLHFFWSKSPKMQSLNSTFSQEKLLSLTQQFFNSTI